MNYNNILNKYLIEDVSNIVYEYIKTPSIYDLRKSELIIWGSYDNLNLKIGDIIFSNDTPCKIIKITNKLFIYGIELYYDIIPNDNNTYTKIYNTKYISNKEKVKFNKNKSIYGYPCFYKLIYDGLFEDDYEY